MRKLLFFSIFLVSILTSKQNYAYQLFGYKWASGTFNYTINPIGVDDSVDYSAYSNTIINAAAAWESVITSNIDIKFDSITSNQGWMVEDNVNVVTWKTNGWEGNVIGVSVSWYWSDGTISESDIKLNTDFADDPRMSQLVTHEVGHSIGIGHTRESDESYDADEYNAIMYWLLHTQTELNREDKCAVTAIYPSSGSCSPTFASGYFECQACCADDGSVSATITDNTYTYNGSDRNVTVITSPSSLSHTLTYTDDLLNVIASPTNAGVYDVTVTITESGYESEGPFYGTLTINKKTLHTTADNKSVDYGAAEPSYTITYSGFENGEGTGVLTSIPSADIVESWPVDPGTYTIYPNGGIDENYNFSYHNGTLTVNELAVNGVMADGTIQIYDGTNKEITITTDPPGLDHTIDYELNGNSVLTQINANIYDAIVTITEPGYNLQQFEGTLTIEKAELTATANDISVLLGAPEPVYTITYTGFENGENETLLTTQPTAVVGGTWPLPAGIYNIDVVGGSDNNYNITRVDGTLTVAGYTADSVSFANLDYYYDGLYHYPTITTHPNGLNYDVTYTNHFNNLVINPTNAGEYFIKVIITEDGYVQDSFFNTLIIEKVSLEITAKNDTVTYGDSEPDYSLLFNGFVNNENETMLDQLPEIETGLSWPLLPGEYTLELLSAEDNNYNYLSTNGTLTVLEANPDSLNIEELFYTYTGTPHHAAIAIYPDSIDYSVVYTNSNDSIVEEVTDAGTYGIKVTVTELGFEAETKTDLLVIDKANLLATAFNYTLNYGDPEPDYLIDYLGFVLEQDSSVLDTIPIASAEGTWPLLPGEYPIFIKNGWDINYNIATQNGVLTIENNGVIISISDTVKTYTGIPQMASITTIPTEVEIEISYLNKALEPIGFPTYPGNYFVKVLATEMGYEPIQTTASFVINKAQLDVTVQNETIEFGENLPEFNYSITGFVNGETENVITQLPTITIEESSIYIPNIYSIVTTGGNADNYSFNYYNGTLTVNPLFIDSFLVYDTITTYNGLSQEIDVATSPADIELNIQYFNSENIQVENPINAGNYTCKITVSETGFFPSSIERSLTIKQAVLEVKVDTININYGEAFPSFEIKIEGFVNNEKKSVLDQLPTVEDIENWPWDVGTQMVNLLGGIDNNYRFDYDLTVIQIHPAMLTIIPFDTISEYNEELPEFSYQITGYAYLDNDSILTSKPNTYVEGEFPLTPGNHTIFCEGAEALNYTFIYQTASLWVEPIGDATFLIEDIYTTYTGTSHEFIVQTEPSDLNYLVDYPEELINAGEYTIYTMLTEPGYVPIIDTSTITIQKAILQASVIDTTILWGDELPEFQIEYEGFIGDESVTTIDTLPITSVGNIWPLDAGEHTIFLNGGNDNNYEFTYLNGTLSIIQTYIVEASAGENGFISWNENGVEENHLWESITIGENSSPIFAIPVEGYRFSGWDNGTIENPIFFENVNENHNVIAQFEMKVGIDELNDEKYQVKIFPNSVEANKTFKLNITLPNYTNTQLNIIDVQGRTVQKIHQIASITHIDGLKQGLYSVQIITNYKNLKVTKLMVK